MAVNGDGKPHVSEKISRYTQMQQANVPQAAYNINSYDKMQTPYSDYAQMYYNVPQTGDSSYGYMKSTSEQQTGIANYNSAYNSNYAESRTEANVSVEHYRQISSTSRNSQEFLHNQSNAQVQCNKPESKTKRKMILRTAGGETWEDPTLLDWDPNDFRIFCGDLGNDVTDEILSKAFSKYPTFNKARVVRDKRTNKTRGFGFVSFADHNDFTKAIKEMNGKYIGSRPIKLRRSNWRLRSFNPKALKKHLSSGQSHKPLKK